MRILAKRVSELIPAEYNPRAISEAALDGLRASIERFGLVEPIVWNERTGRVVGGHQRLRVLIEHGAAETLVVAVDLPESEEKALNVTLNNPHIQGHFTKDLQIVLEDIRVEIPDVFLQIGLGDLYIEPLPDGNGQVDALPGAVPARVASGELWLCGAHRLLCGDATSGDAWDLLMDHETADVAFTDPPYNATYNPDVAPRASRLRGPKANKRKMGGIVGDSMPAEEYARFLSSSLGRLVASLRPGGAFYLCCNWPSVLDYAAALDPRQAKISTCIVWDKGALILDRKDYHASHEFVLYGWRLGAGHAWAGPANETDTWLVQRDPAREYGHPTQKPVELVARALRNSSRRDDVVVDSFGGSGTTMIACEELGRRCRMMEIDPKWCDLALARWERLAGSAPRRAAA